jgi:hypothetical protein
LYHLELGHDLLAALCFSIFGRFLSAPMWRQLPQKCVLADEQLLQLLTARLCEATRHTSSCAASTVLEL